MGARKQSPVLAKIGTGTKWGSTRWKKLDGCEMDYFLSYYERPTIPERGTDLDMGLDGLAVGTLCHYVLERCGRAIVAGKKKIPKGWPLWLERFRKEDPNLIPEIDECERLMAAYWTYWGEHNAGWPKDCRLVAIEQYLSTRIGSEHEVTTQADMVIETEGELWIPDHKTRSQKCPEDFEIRAAVDPQFLQTDWLLREHSELESDLPVAGVVVNALIKTQVPKFERVWVRIDPEVQEAWLANLDRKQDHLIDLEARIKEGKKPIMNFSQCAPNFGFRCWAFDHCHPTLAAREEEILKGGGENE